MMLRQTIVAMAIAIGACLAGTPALADVPPLDACETAGKACQNAGEAGNKPGSCVSTTCERATPSGKMTYACLRCQASTDDGGGCSMATSSADGVAAALMGLFGFASLIVWRRRFRR